MPRSLLVALIPLALGLSLLPGCCVNPFVGTDTHRSPDAPGTPEREVQDTLEEHAPALQTGKSGEGAPVGFDIRLVRVQPAVHIGTEQLCDVAAAGRLEPITLAERAERTETRRGRYAEGATQRMSIQCAAPTGTGWADLTFTATNASHAGQVQPGVRIRVRIRSADGGFFDYPIVEFVAVEGRVPDRSAEVHSALASIPVPTGFDLRQIQSNPSLIGSIQHCAVSHVGDIGILDPAEVRRRSYPAGVQNRMTIRCHHASGEEWADLVFMPAQARMALHIRRGDVIPVTVVARNGGFFDYPVLQYAGD